MSKINYDLAKMLKDKGFPQVSKTYASYGLYGYGSVGGVDARFIIGKEIAESGIDRKLLVYIPTLSELIEACGDDFIALERSTASPSDWYAHGITGGTEDEGYGSNPEEAVTNLWLAQNPIKTQI